MITKGLIVRESLIDEQLPQFLKSYVSRCYPHSIDGINNIEIIELNLDNQAVSDVALQIAQHLKPRLYYAHFVDGDTMTIVFPKAVCLIVKGDSESLLRAQALGLTYNISLEQMQFDKMFYEDHPDA